MSNVDKNSPHPWMPLPDYDDLMSELYNIRLKDGTEHSFMYPNGAAFHKNYQHDGKHDRVLLTDVTHCQLMSIDMDEFYDIFVSAQGSKSLESPA